MVLVAVIPASPDHEINIVLGVALFPTWRAEKRSLDSQVSGFWPFGGPFGGWGQRGRLISASPTATT